MKYIVGSSLAESRVAGSRVAESRVAESGVGRHCQALVCPHGDPRLQFHTSH